ncbi:AraC family transcriptional regulator [Paenibacillus sp. SYP-B3998]|uniref:AraC family transcriptional regulator n=1 Tax=Paenibacillus sp. SYP-B3998 TaxID=2678564 RepID=A0A6G3ZUW4_9BACL|nr:AraC family transcriptional regulator [Paenibacillus sp. SYP-B3998]NEW05860.1 AraC family transcriptional regulator [Paenibacillus sp. SYP-B3998]
MIEIDRNIENTTYISLEDMWFKLREISHIKNNLNEWEIRLQFIESHMLIVAASGQGWITVDGQFIELREGSVYVCTPGQLIEAAAYSFDERGFYHLRFDVIGDVESSNNPIQIVKRDSRFPVKGEVIVSSPVSVNALCETICDCFQGEDRLKRFRSQILFQEVLYNILQDALLVQGNDLEAVLEGVKAYIEQHYQQELTIEHLAKVAGISSRHFMRLFKKRYGRSAIDYLTVFRIKQAQQLMRTGGEYRLQDIARHVGYQDDIYFRRKFKQISGIPPATFMRNNRQKIVAYHMFNIGQLIPLQITPCAAPADHPWTDYYQRKYQTDSVLPLSSDDLIKREELRLADPDFIIGIDILVSAEEQAKIKEIAPTFFVPWMENDWRKHLRLIAQFLDKTTVAETWLENYERKARFVSEQVKYTVKDDSLLILRITGDRYNVLGCRSLDTVFYDDLHIVPARGVDRMKPDQQVTPAQLADFDADRLLLILDEDALSKSSWQTLMHSEPWRGLKAVRNGRVDFLPPYPWVEYTAFTHELILDEALKLWRNRA